MVQFGFPIGRYEVDLVNLSLLIFFASCSITKTEVSCGESGECRAGGLRLFLSHDSSISSYIITYNLRSDLITPVTDYRSIIRIISFHFTVKLPHVLSVTCNIFLVKKNIFRSIYYVFPESKDSFIDCQAQFRQLSLFSETFQ